MQLLRELSAKAIIVVAAIALLFPSSARVLCIAPGLHVQEEDIDAPCSAASGLSDEVDYHPADGFSAAVPAHCTDILLTPYGRGAVLVSGVCVPHHFSVDECPGSQSLEAYAFLLEQPRAENIPPPDFLHGAALPAACVPLRC